VNRQDDVGMTPLHEAASEGRKNRREEKKGRRKRKERERKR